MNLNGLIIQFLLLIFSINIYGQNLDKKKKRGPTDDYSRSSISYLLLDFQGEKHANELKRGIYCNVIPSKYDYNDMKQKTLKVPFVHKISPNYNAKLKLLKTINNNTYYLKKNVESIKRALVDDLYANKIVKYWWQIKDNGTYSTSLFQKRGFYNASDFDVYIADALKKGRSSLSDAGEKLIANSYVMVLDYNNVKTMTEKYDTKDAKRKRKNRYAKPVKRKKKGFKGILTAYLFKINYNDTVQGYLNECFLDEKYIDLSKLDKIFDNVHTPIKYVTSETVKLNATVRVSREKRKGRSPKSNTQLVTNFINEGIVKELNRWEKNISAFRVKTPVTQINPIGAKIGKKEGLKNERRYFVWQYVERKNGEVNAKKKGVVRVRKVVDNRDDELGQTETSVFYQVSGSKIDEGMRLQARKDMGIGVAGGYSTFGGGLFGADFNIGLWLNKPVKQLKFYVEFIYSPNEYSDVIPVQGLTETSTMPETGDYYETKFTYGILKEFPFARNFHAGCYIGMAGEFVTWEDETNTGLERIGEELSSFGINWGIKLGMNLFTHNVHLTGSFGGYHYGEVSYESGLRDQTGEAYEESIYLGQKWTDIFPGKKTFSFNFSIRVTF